MKIFNSRKKMQSLPLYRSIHDLPIWNWEQVKRTNDRRFLIVLVDYTVLPDIEVEERVWNVMLDEYRKAFDGVASTSYHFNKHLEYYIMLRDEVMMSCDEYNPKLSVTKTRRMQMERELEDMPKGSQTIEEQAVIFQIFFDKEPGAFNVKRITTYQWFKYIQEYERRAEQLSKQPRVQKDT